MNLKFRAVALVLLALLLSMLGVSAASAADPVPPSADNESHSPSCETAMIGTPTNVTPPDGTVTIEMDGIITSSGPQPASPGNHTVTTKINGVVVDSDMFYVAPCNAVQVPVPEYPQAVDMCNPAGVVSNVAWAQPLPENTQQVLWSEDAGTRTRTASLNLSIYPNMMWADGSGVGDKLYPMPADVGTVCNVGSEAPQAIFVSGAVKKKGKCFVIAAPVAGAHYVNVKTGKVLREGKKIKVTQKKLKVSLLAESGYAVAGQWHWVLKFKNYKRCLTA